MTSTAHWQPGAPLPLGPCDPRAARGPQSSALADLAAAYARDRPVRSVVVIGNRPLEPSGHRAAVIDSSDLVVRVNSFRVDRPGEPPAYGTAAHVVFVNRWMTRAPHLFEDYASRLFVLVEPEGVLQDPGPANPRWPADLGWVHLSNADVTLPLAAQMGLDGRRDPVWPTSGTLAAWWAVTSFPSARVDLAGFSVMDPDVYSQPWEYAHGGTSARIGPEHRVDQEGRVMRRWLDEGLAHHLA